MSNTTLQIWRVVQPTTADNTAAEGPSEMPVGEYDTGWFQYYQEHPDDTQYGTDLPDDIVLDVAGEDAENMSAGIVFHTDDMPEDFLNHIIKNDDIWRLRQDLTDYIRFYTPDINTIYDAYYAGGLAESSSSYHFLVRVENYYEDGKDLKLEVYKGFSDPIRHRITSDLTPEGTYYKQTDISAVGTEFTHIMSTY